MKNLRFSKSSLLAPLLAVSVLAQTNPIQLEVISATVDQNSHMVRVSVLNHSAKKIVAYVVEVRQFDGVEKLVGEPLTVGTDTVFNLVYGEDSPMAASMLIAPGATTGKHFQASADAVTAKAAVLAVVYLDRTAEGDPAEIALVFKTRSTHAQHASAAAKILADYPAEPAEVGSRLEQLRGVQERTGSANELLQSGAPTREQWSKAAAEQRSLAAVLTSQSTRAIE